MYLSNSQFGEKQNDSEKSSSKNKKPKERKPITPHHVASIDDRLKFAKLMQMLSEPTKPL
jgi:hypothetical protein